MYNPQSKIRRVLLLGVLLATFFSLSCTPDRDFDNRLRVITRPFHFSTARWELNIVLDSVRETFAGGDEKAGSDVSKVVEFSSSVDRIRTLKSEIEIIKSGNRQGDLTSLEAELNDLQQQSAVLESAVEMTLERQIREALSQEGIFNPIDKYVKLEVGFPPLNFKLEKPPHFFVISPRDRIERIRGIALRQVMSREEMEDIEARADELNVSSLVVGLGGFAGTYPSFVTNEADLRFIIDAAAEEWLHQYLVFKPLGFQYMLHLMDISPNYEIATMNETVAGIVSKEIGSIVYKKYYDRDENTTQPGKTGTGFDFNREMRDIRRTVDDYLARGEIDDAEKFMEQKRQFLADNGYYIRKLNQAYFAFHGVYADRPTSINPIGKELKTLRSQSESLKHFLEATAVMTNRQDLIDSLK